MTRRKKGRNALERVFVGSSFRFQKENRTLTKRAYWILSRVERFLFLIHGHENDAHLRKWDQL